MLMFPRLSFIITSLLISVALFSATAPAQAQGGGTVSGDLIQWQTLTISFTGPTAVETDDSPNPFRDYRLQVTFNGPGGQTYTVPGYFAGDGSGGDSGDVWQVRFTPDEAGEWSYTASFRSGPEIAVDLEPTAGTAVSFDGASGAFTVAERDTAAPGFLKWGRLEYADGHYLKFRDGPYWLKGGADSPENILGFDEFDNTPNAKLDYDTHLDDWQPGDPTWEGERGKPLIGALNYLASKNVNSIYFLPMNIGGDAQDTWPFVGPIDNTGNAANDNLHYDLSKLEQWEIVFAHAQRLGIHLHVVLNEAEEPNKRELDDATLGVERKLFYRELIARFGHHNALQWNISEEYDFKFDLGADTVKEFAQYIQDVDPYDHPITVHNQANAQTSWAPFIGDERFSLTSLQYAGSVAGHGDEIEYFRTETATAGRPIPIHMDELRSTSTTNIDAQRKEILWPTYFSGGGGIEWYIASGDQSLDDFRTYEALWEDTWAARSFMESLPFWEMEPADDLLTGEASDFGGGQVFAQAGQIYAIYLPDAGPSGDLDLSGVSGEFTQRWYNPRSGSFEGSETTVSGGGPVALGTPPADPDEDWVVLLRDESAFSTLYLPLVFKNYSGGSGDGGGSTGSCDTADFSDDNGLIVIETESVPVAGDWSAETAINDFTGTAYYEWTGNNLFNNPGQGLLEYKIKIDTTGKYRLQWRSYNVPGVATEHNDAWLRFPDVPLGDFYGEKADGSSIVYPKGSGLTPEPNGAGKDNWFKVYMSQTNKWSWQARTSDNDAHNIFVEFNETGVYTMQISGRSQGFGLDRIVLYNEAVFSGDATDTALTETVCEETP